MSSSTTPDLVFIGNASFDRIKNSSGLSQSVIGGSAYNAAYCARLVCDLSIRISSAVGYNFPLSVLQEQRIDVSGIQIIGNRSNVFIINEETGEIKFEGDPLMTHPLDSEQAGHLHLSCRKGIVHPASCLEHADFSSSSIDVLYSSLEENFEEIKKCLGLVHILFVNEEEYQMLGKLLEDRVERAYPSILIIVTQGRSGIHIRKSHKDVHLPGLDVPGTLVSCLGAGDAFAGSFLGAYYSSRSITDSLATAVSVATVSILDFGISHVINKMWLVKRCYDALITDYRDFDRDLINLVQG